MYNRNFFEYTFRIHEQITPRKRDEKSEVVLYTFKMPVLVEHHGYDLAPKEMLIKQERNLKLLLSALGENAYDDYLYFQIAQSYYILNRENEALEAIKKCFALNPNPKKGYMKVAIPLYNKLMNKA